MLSSQRIAWGLVLGLAATATAWAESQGSLRWRAGATPLGLQAAEWRVPCGSIAFPCRGGAVVALYASDTAQRTVSLQLAGAPHGSWRMAPSPDLNFSLVGKAGIAPTLGVYGRIGSTTPPSMPGWDAEPGLTYGVGLSWDFSHRASAMLGWDSQDWRAAGGDSREVRATSLGLQWRY